MKLKQIIFLISTLISLFGIYWINAGETALKKTGEVAGREEVINYTLPPGFSFSIWGFIYLGFLIYAFCGLRKEIASKLYFNRTVYPVMVSILLNLVWTIIVGLDQWVAAYPLQWIMLAVAIIIMFRFDLNDDNISTTHKWLSIPFALYAGWLTVAMIPFTASLLINSGWDYAPFEARTWAIIIYVVACIIVLVTYRSLKHPFYLLPLAWALFGYFMRFDAEVKWAAAALGIFIFVIFVFQMPRFFRR